MKKKEFFHCKVCGFTNVYEHEYIPIKIACKKCNNWIYRKEHEVKR